jgi:hypothetical protein
VEGRTLGQCSFKGEGIVTPLFTPVCKYYYYCEQDCGQNCHGNVGKTMNLATKFNVYIMLFNKRNEIVA